MGYLIIALLQIRKKVALNKNKLNFVNNMFNSNKNQHSMGKYIQKSQS